MNESFKTTIGGQALIEGVMMRGPSKTAYAVRKPGGDIAMRVEKNKNIADKYPFLNWPIIRGAVKLIEAMVIGVDAIMYSASFWEEEEGGEEDFFTKHFPERGEKIEQIVTVSFSVLLAVLFFMVLPNVLATYFERHITSSVLLNLVEGVFRIGIFFAYMALI